MARHPAGDRGSIMPLVPVITLALLLLGGLVVDASRDLNARSQAQSYAEEAARAGATAIDPNAPDLALRPDVVRSRIERYCATVRARDSRVTDCGFVEIQDTTTNCGGQPAQRPIVVRAQVEMKIPSTLLGIVGITELSAHGDAKARPYEGITAADAC